MAAPPIGRPFEMPMYKDFVPKPVRPWIYLCFIVIIQLVNGAYLGQSSQMAGALSLKREDVMMISYFGIVGVAMPFPILFRLKFRFTNRQLLLFSVGGMIVCQLLVPFVTWVPALCLISFVCCFLKLMGTFECASNIQLWMTPKRDFSVFFPLLYTIIVSDKTLSGWLAEILVYHTGMWTSVHFFVAGLLMIVFLIVFVCTKNYRITRPMPFYGIDWLGCILWSAFLLEGIWVFTYAEFYNWWDSALWTSVVCAVPVTFAFAFWRMSHIHNPYLAPSAFKYRRLLPLILLFVLNEWMTSTPKVLQTALTSRILHWGMPANAGFNAATVIGVICGMMFCLWWVRIRRWRMSQLITVGFIFLLSYQLIMYFQVSPSVNIERLYVPTFLLNFGYAIFFSTLTVYMEEMMTFEHFFMGLTIVGFIRNGLVNSKSCD